MNFIKKIIYQNVIPTIGVCLRGRNKFINVIYYHDIVAGDGMSFMRTPFGLYKQQMEFIAKKGLKTYTFDELTNSACQQHRKDGVLITFDDGWESNYSMIFNFMKSLGLKYNVFLAVEKIGTDPDYLTWEQVREMHQSGLVGFGAHTYTHCNMKSLDGIDLNKEIHQANTIIKEHLGIDTKDFCFPYGAYSYDSIDRIIAKNVYDRIYTSDLNYTTDRNGVLIFGRNGISCNEPMTVFKHKLNGDYNVFNTLTHPCRKP